MSALFEILGMGVVFDPAELLLQGLDQSRQQGGEGGDFDSQLNATVDLLLARRFESAEENLRSYYFSDTISVTGYLVGAALALFRNDVRQALEDLQVVYRRRPNHTLALYCLGCCHERLRQEDEAIAFYQDCLKFKHSLQLPAQRLAALYLKQGRFEQAMKPCQWLREESPDDMTPMLALGHLHLAMGQSREAIDAFSRAIVSYPDSLAYQDHELDRLIQENEFEEALAHVDGILDLYPGRADLLTKRGDVLQLMGDIEQALTEYQQALTISPFYIDASIKLGTLCMKMQSYKQAALHFNHALATHENIIDAYLGLAKAHHQMGEFDNGQAALCSAAMIQPNSSLLYFETARMLLYSMTATGDLLEADPHDAMLAIMQAHQGQLVTQSNSPISNFLMGLCQLYIAGPEAAMSAFNTAVKLYPDYFRAHGKLAICMYALGESENALTHLASLSVPSKESLQLYYQTALLYGEPVKFAGTMMNLSRTMAENWAEVDPAAQITAILENLGVIEREEHQIQCLEETLASTLVAPGDDDSEWV